MEELTFEQTNELEVTDGVPADESCGKKKRGGVFIAILGTAIVGGLIAKRFKKTKKKRQAKRNEKDIKRLREQGYLVTPPMLDVDETDSDDKESK